VRGDVPVTKAEEAAQWMWGELQREGWLGQVIAAYHIHDHISEDLVYRNQNGNPAIHPAVLIHFTRLHQGKARWYKPPDSWWRLEGDK
jgi:hypothetical protein